MKTGCVILAAGAGTRFGGKKLTAAVNGSPIFEYIFDSLPLRLFHRVVVVTAEPLIIASAERRGFGIVLNDRPELGVSRSIRLGLETMADTQACMFCVADQPLLKKETISGMLDAYESGSILMTSYNDRSGNPVIYPASLYSELIGLTGETFGKAVARLHLDLLRMYPVDDAYQLIDIDTREDLAVVETRLHGAP
jgi:molybdenum cofactor cytidylyltransferase